MILFEQRAQGSASVSGEKEKTKPNAAALQQRLLVLMFMTGDVKAFEALFHAYHLRLLSFIRKIIKNQDCAEDVGQEAWIAIHKNRMQLRNPDLFRAWIFSVARNRAYQHLRRFYKEPILESLTENIDVAVESSDEHLEAGIDRLYFALDRLNTIHREVLVLKYIEGLSYEEISEVIAENIGTVRSRLFNAKKAMSEIIEKLKRLDS